ncbi:MAG TPA: GSU2403 family nucleotidyltransferase fold protein [Beijerinckiaceae bacterium]|nr:GSU2403 family nucleotidyltransferase fold protein [Beijerinckiaceae bacterium]
MIERLSPLAQTTYVDLVAALQDEAVAAVRGTPSRVTRGKRAYWYDMYRIGASVRRSYIGEDTPELRARLERERPGADDLERQRYRARLIRVLRAEGFMGTDAATGSLLGAMQKAGVFRLGGVLVGTAAFRLYQGELGLRYRLDDTAQTNDIDIASFERLSLALEDVVSESLQNVLADFEFDPVPSLDPGKVWRWRQTRSNLLVEFLTPSFDADEGIRPLAALGVEAQALHYLNYLIAEPVAAALTYRSGVLIHIPRPERFAIHKLIVADRRREGVDSLKAVKDRAQAAFLINALSEDRPDDLAEAYEDAMARGSRWRERIAATLRRMPEATARLEASGISSLTRTE